MKLRLAGWWMGLVVGLVVMSSSVALADSSDSTVPLALAGAMLTVILVFSAVMYVYVSLALMTIANKTGTPNGWLAWIPIANIVLMLMIAKKPIWWILLFLIPLVNIVMAIIVWMGVAEARNKPSWWGILMIVPGVNLIVPGYLAWAD